MIEFIKWQLAIFAGAILAVQIAYASTLAQDIKKLIGLTKPTERKWKWWVKPAMVIVNEIRELFQCPYCLSFWICTLINYGFFSMDIMQSALYGLLGLAYVLVWEKITLK